jgi:hypothetical protein
MLDEYRQSQSDLNEEWDAKELELKKKHDESLQALNDQRNQLMLSSVSDGLGSMVDITKQAFGEQSAVYKAAFVAQKAVAIAQSMIAIQQGIAMAAANLSLITSLLWLLLQLRQQALFQTSPLLVWLMMGWIACQRQGPVVAERERVTTAKTSAKLDATLDRVNKQSTSQQAGNITVPIEIHAVILTNEPLT